MGIRVSELGVTNNDESYVEGVDLKVLSHKSTEHFI